MRQGEDFARRNEPIPRGTMTAPVDSTAALRSPAAVADSRAASTVAAPSPAPLEPDVAADEAYWQERRTNARPARPSKWGRSSLLGKEPVTRPNTPPSPPADIAAPTRPIARQPEPEQPTRRAADIVMRPPKNLDELKIPFGLVEDMFLRRLLATKRATTGEIARDLGLSMMVVQGIADELRDKSLLEYLGLDGREYRFGLTTAGQETTLERMKISMYSGIAPVSLADYNNVIERQRAVVELDMQAALEAFDDLVLESSLVKKLGAALLNEGAIFLYGPPGTGKTSIAERMNRIFQDHVLVPHCIEVDGNIVMVFDPSIHLPVAEQPEGLDPRWVLCRRPIVLVGGELTLEMLDLAYEATAGVYAAPIQLQANNGILVVDDFGRQAHSPDELLNRWIVPLSRDVDFLKLTNGNKFTVPFATRLVVSSNLDPKDLGDDAFLRRLRNKVFVGPCTEAAFVEVLKRTAHHHQVSLTEDSAPYLMSIARSQLGELRPYVAADFCELLQGVCAFEKRPKILDREMIDLVADVYFVDGEHYGDRPNS